MNGSIPFPQPMGVLCNLRCNRLCCNRASGLSDDDIFRIGVRAKNCFKGLNLMAFWRKEDFIRLDKSSISGAEGDDDLSRVARVGDAINDQQSGVFSILGSGSTAGLIISGAALFPEVGIGPKGSMLKFRTLQQVPEVTVEGVNRIEAGSLKEFISLVQQLSTPGSQLTKTELQQFEKLTEQFGENEDMT